MKEIIFSIAIEASAEKVWFSLWNKTNYENWTSIFSQGSYAISEWTKDSKIHFLMPTGDGMFSEITELIPNQQISFQHKGEIKGFEEQEIKNEWSDSKESYFLSEENNKTILKAALTIDEKWQEFFDTTFPKALEKVKNDAENNLIKTITVQTLIDKSLAEVWDKYTQPEHVVNWNFASDDWHCPKAENDLKNGGTFSYTMASKDNSMSFNLKGTYTEVVPHNKLNFYLEDNRKVYTDFKVFDNKTLISVTFEPENENSIFLQRDGWQSILNNFKKYLIN